ILLCGLVWCGQTAAAELPPWLPRYDLDVRLEVQEHRAVVRQRVTWTNRHNRPASGLVFNAHSHFKVPDGEIGFYAKMLEILRIQACEALYCGDSPLQVEKVTLVGGESGGERVELAFHYREDNQTALVVPLPKAVGKDESVTIEMSYTLQLPPYQGRWGQWEGVTFLSNWLPVLAVYDESGWQPTPFIPWHQPFFNEAGIFSVRITLPADQKLACTASVFAVKDLGNGWRQVDCMPVPARDFAILCSDR